MTALSLLPLGCRGGWIDEQSVGMLHYASNKQGPTVFCMAKKPAVL